MSGCPNCGENAVSVEDVSTVCTNCGYVIAESNITSDVAFAEGGDGSSNVIGQFVSDTGGTTSRAIRSISGQRHHREVTLANGRRRIMHLASALKLNATHVDAAFRFFMLAVQHNFTQGRRTPNVVAACLYVVCRRHKTPHMLIDFSDVLQINLFVLGNTFFRLCRTLKITPPLIDPSLYIHRFAAALNLGEHELDISNTALRLVQRMKRDWIQIGRRPAGVCGAALFIASRIHRVLVNQQLILHTVKVCDMTLRRRVAEFRILPSAQLTFEDFQLRNPEYKGDPDDDLTDATSADPPIFTYHRKKEEEARRKQRFLELLPSEPTTSSNGTTNNAPTTITRSVAANGDVEATLSFAGDSTDGPSNSNSAEKSNPRKRSAENIASGAPGAKRSADGFAVPNVSASSLNRRTKDSSQPKFGDPTERREMDEAFDEMLEAANAGTAEDDDKETSYGVGMDEQMQGAMEEASERQLTEMNAKALDKPPMEIAESSRSGTTPLASVPTSDLLGNDDGYDETELDASDIPDSAVEAYLNTEEEARIKEILWVELNRDYLEEMEEKKKAAALAEAEGRQPKKRTRAPRTAAEKAALAAEPKERSKGINWEAVNRANQQRAEVGTPKTRHMTEGAEDDIAGEYDDADEHDDAEDLELELLRKSLVAPGAPRPTPAFLGSLRPTIPKAPSSQVTSTQATTQAYGDDDDDDDDDDDELLSPRPTSAAAAHRRSSTGSKGDDALEAYFKRPDDDDYDEEDY